MKKNVVVLSAVTMMAIPVLGIAAMAGSNTVNSTAIVDGAVATADIASKAVTASKIADATITATQLASGSVTDAKISGTISASKLPIGTTVTSIAAGNHSHDTVYTKKYSNYIVVAKSGGDFTNPSAAINSISSASATNPFLVKVMPGVYDLGTSSLKMKEYVTLVGSGESSIITSTADTAPNAEGSNCDGGTIRMANSSSLQNIKIVNRGYTTYDAIGVSFRDVIATLDGVTVISEPGSATQERNAVCAEGALSDVIISNSRLESSSINGESSPVEMSGSAKVLVTNSRLAAFTVNGHTHGIDCNHEGNDGSFTLFNSLLEVAVTGEGEKQAFYFGDACNANISNSKINVKGGGYTSSVIDANKDLSIVNSQIYTSLDSNGSQESMINSASGNTRFIKISNSILQGVYPDLTGIKFFNSTDENLNPIVNQ